MHLDKMANELLAAITLKKQIQPFTNDNILLSNSDAYAVSRRLSELRQWEIVGRKIGFTNRTIWPLYGVDQPMWGPMSASTISYVENGKSKIKLSDYCEPRIEPEIVVSFASAPPANASEEQIVNCIDWVAPGFEIVDSVYPDWKFSIPDTIAAGGLHGQLIIGQKFLSTESLIQHLIDQKVTLSCNNQVVEEGYGYNVLDGPISALKHLLDGIFDETSEKPIKAGDIVTTGTLTDAKPLRVGETWCGNYTGLINSSLSIKII